MTNSNSDDIRRWIFMAVLVLFGLFQFVVGLAGAFVSKPPLLSWIWILFGPMLILPGVLTGFVWPKVSAAILAGGAIISFSFLIIAGNAASSDKMTCVFLVLLPMLASASAMWILANQSKKRVNPAD
jgi:hypothetical protein